MADNKKVSKELLDLWRFTDDEYTNFLKQWNLTPNEYWVLEHLLNSPDGTEPSLLAQKIHEQPQLITFILRSFEKRSFIVREENKEDHRRRIIRLTQSGKEFATEVCNAANDLDIQGYSVFSAEEQRQFLEYSRRYLEAIKLHANPNNKKP